MNPGEDEVDIASPLNRTGSNEKNGDLTQPAAAAQPAASTNITPSARPSGVPAVSPRPPASNPAPATNRPAPATNRPAPATNRPAAATNRPAPTNVNAGRSRVPAPANRPPGPTRPPVSRPVRPTRTPGPVRGTPINHKPRRISALRRYCVPVTTVVLVLASLVVIAILIKVVLDNYYFFCVKSFKFIPLDKWCDGQSDCSGNEDEQRCVQKVDFSNSSIVRLTDANSVLQILTSFGTWSYICFNNFDTASAKAVCAQLGYSSNPSFSSTTVTDANGLYSNVLVNAVGIQLSPINGVCTGGSVVSLKCSNCGINYKKDRIIGGHDAPIESSPWQVSLQYMGQHTCGGSIVTSHIVLSAAHCFQKTEQQVDRWRVQAGNSRLTYLFASQVDKIYVHSKYTLDQKANDIALLRLKNDLVFSASVKPVCLPGFDNNLASGASLSVTGWGDTVEGGSLASTLQEVTVTLITNDVCNREYFGQIQDSMLCAGRLSGGLDTCQGDSGGPLVFLGGNSPQVGVVSWGDGCGRPGKVGVYTRVSSYLSWIYTLMKVEM